MAKYRKKPIVIEATQWFPGVFVEGVVWPDPNPTDNPNMRGARIEPCVITLEGRLHVSPGDWIITGVKGERYPCKPDIFAATYESCDGTPIPWSNEPVLDKD
jgi:hypothetical protein